MYLQERSICRDCDLAMALDASRLSGQDRAIMRLARDDTCFM